MNVTDLGRPVPPSGPRAGTDPTWAATTKGALDLFGSAAIGGSLASLVWILAIYSADPANLAKPLLILAAATVASGVVDLGGRILINLVARNGA